MARSSSYQPLDETSFAALCTENSIHITSGQLSSLSRYVVLLREANARVNLISRKDQADVWRQHLLHSISVMTLASFVSGKKYFDLGTGGGLPGIPLAILNESCEFVLCDSIGKKIREVQAMVDALMLPNVRTVCARAEEIARDEANRSCYDAVLARAVTSLRDLARYSAPMLRGDGQRLLIAYKGGALDEEIASLKKLTLKTSVRTAPIHLVGESYFEEQEKSLVLVSFD